MTHQEISITEKFVLCNVLLSAAAVVCSQRLPDLQPQTHESMTVSAFEDPEMQKKLQGFAATSGPRNTYMQEELPQIATTSVLGDAAMQKKLQEFAVTSGPRNTDMQEKLPPIATTPVLGDAAMQKTSQELEHKAVAADLEMQKELQLIVQQARSSAPSRPKEFSQRVMEGTSSSPHSQMQEATADPASIEDVMDFGRRPLLRIGEQAERTVANPDSIQEVMDSAPSPLARSMVQSRASTGSNSTTDNAEDQAGEESLQDEHYIPLSEALKNAVLPPLILTVIGAAGASVIAMLVFSVWYSFAATRKLCQCREKARGMSDKLAAAPLCESEMSAYPYSFIQVV